MLDGPDDTDNDEPLVGKTPYEPDEFDPSSLGPDVPEAPEPPDGIDGGGATGLFWKLVVVFNVALLALAVGPMLAYFEGQVDLGIRVTLVGVVAFGYGYFRYRRFVKERDDEASDDEAAGGDTDATDHNG